MKQKQPTTIHLYIGNILKYKTITPFYKHMETVMKGVKIIGLGNHQYMTEEDYIQQKKRVMNAISTKEEEWFVDEASLVEQQIHEISGIISKNGKKKSLHFY